MEADAPQRPQQLVERLKSPPLLKTRTIDTPRRIADLLADVGGGQHDQQSHGLGCAEANRIGPPLIGEFLPHCWAGGNTRRR